MDNPDRPDSQCYFGDCKQRSVWRVSIKFNKVEYRRCCDEHKQLLQKLERGHESNPARFDKLS